MPKFIDHIEDPTYTVEFIEKWGSESIYCGADLEKAKKILIGKSAEGYAAWICVDKEHLIMLEDDEDSDDIA